MSDDSFRGIIKNLNIDSIEIDLYAIKTFSEEDFSRKYRIDLSANNYIINLQKKYLDFFIRYSKSLAYGNLKVLRDVLLLEKIPHILRKSDWGVSTVLWDNRKIISVEPGDTTSECYGIAMDVGSSKIVAQLVDLNSGETLVSSGAENPQLMYGEDVVERVRVSEENGMLKHLQELVIQEINKLLNVITEDTDVNPANIYEAVVVGNTVMNHIFLGISPRSIAFSPYTPVITSPYNTKVSDIGLNINPNGIIHIPANIAGFVGADATADMIASLSE